MVKRLCAFTAALMVALLLPLMALAERPLVVDDAGLFTSSEIARIAHSAQYIIDTYQMDVVVVTSRSVQDGNTVDFADRYYEDNGYGLGEDRAGILYLIDMNNRQFYFSTAGVMIDYISDYRKEELLDAAEPGMLSGDYAQSALDFLSRLDDFLDYGLEEGRFRYDEATGERLTGLYNKLTRGELIVAALAGLAAAGLLIVIVFFKYNLRGKTYHYDKSNMDTRLTEDTAQPVRSTVHRVAKVQSSGGGGSGSGTHVSSGGMSHGGGGRGF